jgi:hypothetical protein
MDVIERLHPRSISIGTIITPVEERKAAESTSTRKVTAATAQARCSRRRAMGVGVTSAHPKCDRGTVHRRRSQRDSGGPRSDTSAVSADPDRLLRGIEAQMAMSTWLDDDAMADEVIEAEWARTSLLDRLRAATDPLDITVPTLAPIRGLLEDWTSDAIVLRDDRATLWLIPLRRILRVSGLGPEAVRDHSGGGTDDDGRHDDDRDDARPTSVGVVRRSRRLTAIVREWSRQQTRVTAFLMEGSALDGTIVRVGADHIDLALGSGRRRETVPLSAICALRFLP